MMLLIHVQIRHQRKLYKQNSRNAVFEFLVYRLMVLKSQLHILAEWCERKRGHLEIRPFSAPCIHARRCAPSEIPSS